MDIYKEVDPDQLKLNTLEAWFSGVFNQIYLASGKYYNISEIIFFYKTIGPGDYDPANVLDYETDSRYSTEPSTAGQFLGVQFNRIKILPFAYALKSDSDPTHLANRLVSWAFQRQIAGEEWVTLDERCKNSSLLEPEAMFLGYIDTDIYFTRFRIIQTGSSNKMFLSFGLSGFEIHGLIQPIC